MYKSISVLTLLTGIIAVDVVLAQSTVNLPIRVKQGESYEGLLTRASQLAEKLSSVVLINNMVLIKLIY